MPLPLPKAYVCRYTDHPIEIDGSLSSPIWDLADWTDDFVDIEGPTRPTPRFKTRAKMLWDQEKLYIGAEMEEPQVWATLTEHDSVIFHDNDFEVFIDPDNDGCFYAEFEMNALNTTWDLLLPRSYRGGGPPIDGFELKGLESAVRIHGTLNDPSSGTRSWSTEIAIPWLAFKDIAKVNYPPKDRDQWRLNFSRVEWQVDVVDGKYKKRPGLAEDNWVWSPIGVIDMHRPEQWGILQFSTSSDPNVTADPSPGFHQRRTLIEAWEAQMTYRRTHHRWAIDPSELGLDLPGLRIAIGLHQFELELDGFVIDQSLRFSKL